MTLHEVIFEADTPAGKGFDVLLIASILASVAAVMLDSVGAVRLAHGRLLSGIEWFFTLIFTIEYLLRLLCVGRPLKYVVSFYGVVDLLAIIPTYLSLVLPGSHYLIVIRILRILRIFRILKLVPYLGEARLLMNALAGQRPQDRRLSLHHPDPGGHFRRADVCHRGRGSRFHQHSTQHLLGHRHPDHGWLRGDIAPQTGLGQALSSVVMILGYGIIAVPTGIVTVEMSHVFGDRVSTQVCPECSAEGHDADARHCKHCGAML